MSAVSWRCTRTNFADRKSVVLHYSRIADVYDSLRFRGKKDRFISNLQIRWFIGQVEDLGGMILEIGSGTGRVTLPLAAHVGQIVATDPSLNMVIKLREKSRKQKVTNIELLICDSHWLPFREETFDSAVGARVFWHLANARRPIAQALGVLRQNGSVIFDFPNSSGAFRLLSSTLKSQTVVTLFLTSSSIRRMLGFAHSSIAMEGHVSPILYLWPESIFPRRKISRSLLYALEGLGKMRTFSWMFTYFMVVLRAE